MLIFRHTNIVTYASIIDYYAPPLMPFAADLLPLSPAVSYFSHYA